MNKVENYDAGEIAKIVTDHGLYEEALTIYKKYDQHTMAINVLIEHIVSLTVDLITPAKSTGLNFGADLLRPNWMAYGLRTLLVCNISLFLLILNPLSFFFLEDSYIKAEDLANFAEVIEISNRAGKHDDLVRFKWLANLFVSRESIRSWHMRMPGPITCTTWRTSLA